MAVPRSLLAFLGQLPRRPFPRDPSAEEAERELSKQIYQRERPSLVLQALDWLADRIASLVDRAGNASPGGGVGFLVLVALAVAVVVVVLVRFGPLARTARVAARADEVRPTLTGADHRARADALAAEGRFAEALRERLRAVVATLVERGVVEDRPGRTATEVATEGGRTLPGVAIDLLDAATLFAEVWYGGRTATAASDARMREIDAAVVRAAEQRTPSDDGDTVESGDPATAGAGAPEAGRWASPAEAGGGAAPPPGRTGKP